MRLPLAIAASLALLSAAGAAPQKDAKTVAVQIATLAKLAPLTCPDMSVDDDAVEAFLRHAGVNADDLDTTYHDATRAIGEALSSSISRNKDAACSQLWNQLGDGGLGLVTRTGDSQ